MTDTIFNATTANSEVIDLTEARISSYLDFYKADHSDVYDGKYEGLMNLYKVPIDFNLTTNDQESKRLHGGVIQTKEIPQALVMLTPHNGKLLLVHRLSYFPHLLGSTDTKEWEDRIIGFSGDVMGTQLPQPIFVTSTVLKVVEEIVKVQKTLAMRLQLEATPGLEVFPPVGADEPQANYDSICTRYMLCAFRPSTYISS